MSSSEEDNKQLAKYDTDNKRTLISGDIEEIKMSENDFKELYYGNKKLKKRPIPDSNTQITASKRIKKERYKNNDPNSDNFLGPWAVYKGEEEYDKINRKADPLNLDDQNDFFLKDESQAKFPGEMDPYYHLKTNNEVKDKGFQPSSTLHIDEENDYKGRSYIEPPSTYTLKSCLDNYIPKKCVGILKGHTKGVQVVRFTPRYAHLVLSCSLDNTIKIWDVLSEEKKCLRTYNGHTEAVKDICFTNDGRNFLSAGFDSRLQFWDTEKGKVISSWVTQKHPYCVKINPDVDRQHLFLSANLNSEIEQYDVRIDKKTVSYTDHLESVNALLFVDNNKKFVSCGDDKRIYMWEFGTPVVIKNISENDLHTISTLSRRPDDKYFLAQSSDNRLLVFDIRDSTLKWNRKKFFRGHGTAGYCINSGFSNNGKIVGSGSEDGKLYFWDWKTGVLLQTINAHSKVCNWFEWSPNDNSMIVSCSWDNSIKLWQ